HSSRVEVRVHLERSGVVVLHDQFDPWWIATVDGVRTPVLRANYVFRGIRVGSGDHLVRFEYRPLPFYAGAVVTLISVGVTAAVVARLLHRRRGSRTP